MKNIDIVQEIKDTAAKKSAKITAKKLLQKYKTMKRPKKTFLVNKEDVKTIDYNEPQEDLFKNESIVEAANKMLDFNEFKKEQAKALKKSKNGKQITSANILKKYKNLKKPKKTYLVNEEDLEMINYHEPQEDLFKGKSIIAAASKMLDFNEFKKEQAKALKKSKNGKQITSANILKKYKNLKKPKKTYLVDEEDLETINYDEPQKDLLKGESILEA